MRARTSRENVELEWIRDGNERDRIRRDRRPDNKSRHLRRDNKSRHCTRDNKSRRGAVVVELALVTPLLLILTLGICELGQAFKIETILSAATRAGCTTGTRPGCSNTDVIADINAVLAANQLSSNLATVTILVNDVSGDVATATLDDKITVTVSIPTSQVIVVNTLTYLGVNSLLSQTTTMLKQG